MEDLTLFNMLITTFVALFGWFIIHKFTSLRELKNKQREIRVNYLLKTYMCLEKAISHSSRDTIKIKNDLELAIAEIQLLGTKKQISLSKEIGLSFAKSNGANLEELLILLRNDLRSELNLESVSEKINYLRINSLKG